MDQHRRFVRLAAAMPLLVLYLGGCAAEEPPPAEGSWVEVIREPVFHPWARFPEQEEGFQSVEVNEDHLIFTFTGASPIEVDTVVAGAGGAGNAHPYTRHVSSIEVLPDGRIRANTMQAMITHLIRDAHIIVHYRPTVNEEYVSVGLDGEVAGLRAASGDCSDSAPCPLLGEAEFSLDTGTACSLSGGGAASVRPFVEPSVTADFDLDIGGIGDFASCGASTISFGLLGDCEGVVDRAVLTVDGSITAGIQVAISGAVGASCTLDGAALLGGGDAPSVVLAAFSVGPVPITIRAEPVLEASLGLAVDAGAVQLTAQATFGAIAEVGYDDEWISSFDPYMNSLANLETTRAGGIEATAGARVGAKILVLIVDGAGPYVQMTAGIEGSFETGFDGCEYTAGVDISLEAEFGAELQIPVLGVELASVSLPAIELASWPIFETSGTLPWCGGSMTCTGDATCRDDVFDRDVCEGGDGFKSCIGPAPAGMAYVQRCTCNASGWAACSSCMTIATP